MRQKEGCSLFQFVGCQSRFLCHVLLIQQKRKKVTNRFPPTTKCKHRNVLAYSCLMNDSIANKVLIAQIERMLSRYMTIVKKKTSLSEEISKRTKEKKMCRFFLLCIRQKCDCIVHLSHVCNHFVCLYQTSVFDEA